MIYTLLYLILYTHPVIMLKHVLCLGYYVPVNVMPAGRHLESDSTY